MAIFRYMTRFAVLGALVSAPTAQAKIIDQSEIGFTVAHTAQVAAPPAEVWKMLRMPQSWWSKEHSWSGDAANFWLDSQAGGCFCEKLPDAGAGLGSVQHARIVFAKPNELLRLSGALGPLQGEAVSGTLTIQIKETPTGSALRFDYVVGGYMRFKVADIAPAVDAVIGEQIKGLAAALGGALSPALGDKTAGEADTPAQEAEGDLDAAVAELDEKDAAPRPDERL
ncbi:MAG: hypothetical protein RIA72_17445 [Sphingopyxis sp.]|uniref:hypothetical protein n=1 Tax=Sphingopyxis sp. TaxID=1908224 RepID=UPI0032EF331B